LPYLILLQCLMAAGLMFALSAISVLFYDVEHALPAVTRLLFYMTPIFYPYSMVPDVAHPYYDFNPFVGIIRLYHTILYEGVWPSWTLLGTASAIAVAMFILGYWVFQQLKEVSVEIA
jgi:lipopolysaccharide transport system permease protein